MNDDNTPLASAFRMQATIFRMSAEVLYKDFEAKGERLPNNFRAIPFYYLATHAAELLLKCALLKRGITVSTLKKSNIRHDLIALLDQLKNAD